MAVANGLNPAFQSVGIGAGIVLSSGSGAPSHTSVKGSLYIRTDGSSTSTRLYINNGTTNWVAITTAS